MKKLFAVLIAICIIAGIAAVLLLSSVGEKNPSRLPPDEIPDSAAESIASIEIMLADGPVLSPAVLDTEEALSPFVRLIESAEKTNAPLALSDLLQVALIGENGGRVTYTVCAATNDSGANALRTLSSDLTANLFLYDSRDYYEINSDALRALLSDDRFSHFYALPPPDAPLLDAPGETLAPYGLIWTQPRLDGSGYSNRYYDETYSARISVDKYAPVEIFVPDNGFEAWSFFVNGDACVLKENAAIEITPPGKNGAYIYEITAVSEEGHVTASYLLEIEYSIPPVFEALQTSVDPGEIVVFYAKYLEPDQKIEVTTNLNYKADFFDVGDVRVCLFPMSYNNTIGDHNVSFSVGGVSQTFTITLQNKQFEIQRLTVDSSVASSTVDSSSANYEYNRFFDTVKLPKDPQAYWSGPFIWPVEGEITTQFGMIRYTNNSTTGVRHTGIDIAARRGTPVAASGAGRVIFSQYLQMTGNTIVIEHGFGLKSWYFHMDSLAVSADDMVAQGQTIGTIGSTGFSTGPHLHFSMSVNGVYVNPFTAFETDFLLSLQQQ